MSWTSPRRGVALGFVLLAAIPIATSRAATPPPATLAAPPTAGQTAVCPVPSDPLRARCLGEVRTEASGRWARFSAPLGYGPSDLRNAYRLPASSTRGRAIALVVAFDAPRAGLALARYRARFGEPPLRLGQFRKVNQRGGTRLPPADPSWALEAALDTQMASAICPNCDIVLVEADSDALPDLADAARMAAQMPGVVSVSNSYGLPEIPEALPYEASYRSSKAWVTVAAGDSGFGVMAPAAFTGVVAVGGTRLEVDGRGRRASETAWSGGGSGCSALSAKPDWQRDAQCRRRTVTDVAAVADPDTGVAVLVDEGSGSGMSWVVAGGTSVSSPIVAGVHALTASSGGFAGSLYGRGASVYDVTAGSNGTCAAAYECTARPGYDGPTGVGTPDGTAGF